MGGALTARRRWLQSNQLSGTVPGEWGSLTSASYLYLDDELTGAINAGGESRSLRYESE